MDQGEVGKPNVTKLLTILAVLLLAGVACAQKVIPAKTVTASGLQLETLMELCGEHPRRSVLQAMPYVKGDWISSAAKCREPVVRDLVFEGHKVGGKYFVGEYSWPKDFPVDKFPQLYNINFNASGGTYKNIRIRYLPGEIRWTRGFSTHEWDVDDNPENVIENVIVKHCYGPVRLDAGDAVVDNLIVSCTRSGIVVEAPTQLGTVHAYACGDAAIHFVDYGVTTGSANVYGESSPYGMIVDTNNVHLAYFHSINCWVACALIKKPVTILDSYCKTNENKPAWQINYGGRDSQIAGKVVILKGGTGIELGASDCDLNLNAGGVGLGNGTTYLRVTGRIDRCRIYGRVWGCDTVLDLREMPPSSWGNRFEIMSKGNGEAVLWPEKWNPSNKVFVNGGEQLPEGT